jgi:hypothetical protein
MKLKLVCHFCGFSMIFGEFCKISLFIEKKKNKEKEKKGSYGLGPAHNKADPTARILLKLKKDH